MSKLQIEPGFAETERAQVAQMYWQAFGPKLGRVMRPEAKALTFLAGALDPAHAIAARGVDGALLGVAGYKTSRGALISGGFDDLRQVYGLLSALWRAPLLALLERDLSAGILQMDGIFVTADARGQGVGTALLQAICDTAQQRGDTQVRLDVIDTNPRARALYERFGFRAVAEEHLGPLRYLFGFRSATRMVRDVAPAAT